MFNANGLSSKEQLQSHYIFFQKSCKELIEHLEIYKNSDEKFNIPNLGEEKTCIECCNNANIK